MGRRPTPQTGEDLLKLAVVGAKRCAYLEEYGERFQHFLGADQAYHAARILDGRDKLLPILLCKSAFSTKPMLPEYGLAEPGSTEASATESYLRRSAGQLRRDGASPNGCRVRRARKRL
jgi:hypothetical protein